MFRENWCESLWRVANVRILYIWLCVFDDFGERHNSFILYWFCKCFVKMHLTIVGGCQMFVFDLFYNVLFMISWSWKGQTEPYSVFYVSCISVSWKLMWEFVEGCQCSNLVYFIVFLMISVNVTIHLFYIVL